MKQLAAGVLLTWLAASGPVLAADRTEHLLVPPPVRKNIAAMPLIADPADEAERRINEALKRLDGSVLRAARECKGGDWQRTVEAPMRGPGFLSLTVTDSVFCDSNAHPDASTFSIVYDLITGRPADWTQLLPASLTGSVALRQQSDGTRIVTLASKHLFDLYMAEYGVGQAPGADLDECKQVLWDQATDGPPAMMVWLDGKAHGLAVLVGLPHVMAPCEAPVVIRASVLAKEGARPALLQAFDAGRRR